MLKTLLPFKVLLLFIFVSLSLTTVDAQFNQVVKTNNGNGQFRDCIAPGTTIHFPVFLINLQDIDELPCDLHVGVTDLQTNEITYQRVLISDFTEVEAAYGENRLYQTSIVLTSVGDRNTLCEDVIENPELSFNLQLFCGHHNGNYTEINFCQSSEWMDLVPPLPIETQTPCTISEAISFDVCCLPDEHNPGHTTIGGPGNSGGHDDGDGRGGRLISNSNSIDFIVPNKSSSTISMRNSFDDVSNLLIHNINGLPFEISSSIINENEITLQHQSLPAGMYILSVFTDGKLMSKKFVIM